MGGGYEGNDEASAGMAAHFSQTITMKEHYRLATRQAAAHERAAEWDEAVRWWQSAGQWAITHLERHWCESRTQLCARRLRE
ncbi:TPA: ANR family transcriptional regulator [Serratia marcescens]|uniref:ANR family transcriptional regulator n=1 Tax=Serratia marcescens TaxID=615 RepID=UPI0038CAD63A